MAAVGRIQCSVVLGRLGCCCSVCAGADDESVITCYSRKLYLNCVKCGSFYGLILLNVLLNNSENSLVEI